MRRADRLFQIVLYFRAHRFATARQLAEALEVSERTIYRDINELLCCGVPIEGEAGVGYRIHRRFDLPPLMFDREELEALRLGARMVKAWADSDLARAADYALAKIDAALPEDLRAKERETRLYAPDIHPYPVQLLGPLRQAMRERRKVRFGYARADGERSRRTVQPLGLFFWGNAWTLVAWCELRDDFRHFRLHQMNDLAVSDDRFAELPGRALADFLRRVADDAYP